jgi:hypothetical protein
VIWAWGIAATSLNLASPGPLPYGDFMRCLRKAAGVRVGSPATKWMIEIGAFLMRTDTEFLLESRRVVLTMGSGKACRLPGTHKRICSDLRRQFFWPPSSVEPFRLLPDE